MTALRVSGDEIAEFCRQAFRRIHCPAPLAEPTVHALVQASLRGVDSHGVGLMPHYIDAALIGRINLSPTFRVTRTSTTTELLDADHTYGAAAATEAMRHSIEMARDHGMGATAVTNSSHFGAAAVYALIAAEADMIGLSFTHAEALVAPYGGKAPYLGTNPLCFAAPCEGEAPFCLDMATSATSWNNVKRRRATGNPLEPGWAIDVDGVPCADPHVVGALLPSGGYKGFGLALVVEILCSLLTGMAFGPHVTPMFPVDAERRRLGHFFMAIDIARFTDVGAFKHRLAQLASELRSRPIAPGCERVRVANDPEKEHYAARSHDGIPLGDVELDEFRRIATSLQLEEPWFLSREHAR